VILRRPDPHSPSLMGEGAVAELFGDPVGHDYLLLMSYSNSKG
jgi:hypothetical protein